MQKSDEEAPLLGGRQGEGLKVTEDNVMTYTTNHLASWKTFTFFSGTIIQDPLLWHNLLKLTLLAVTFSAGLMMLGVDPRHVRMLQLDVITATINVFVGLMLAFFLNSSVARWINSVNGVLRLFDSIRNLSMQLITLGVPRHLIRTIQRYGVLSCQFLVMELHARELSNEEKEQHIEDLRNDSELRMEEWELKSLKELFGERQGIAGLMWIWISSACGRMAKDGWIPPMASPTYGRILNLCEAAQTGIRQTRVSMTVQLPFIYTHTLALLVHSNNIISAINFGTTLTGRLSAILYLLGVHFQNIELLSEGAREESQKTLVHGAAICKGFVIYMVAPIIYQGFLQIGLMLSQPFDPSFGDGIAQIPTTLLIDNLRKDLKHTEQMIDGIKGWEIAHFKDSPA